MSDPNPTPKSPKQISEDPNYEVMGDYIGGSWYPSAAEMIVKHKASNTFWRAVYSMRENDSDFAFGATWKQVRPEQRTITEYKVI